ncbi:MAG: apolipoprotein N-acyltransferase [Endomicrobium sp.]|jgi:apolipoprotein N-acyltransferase|nr:apolipoprotein N-acyltransferase [Endomicrobium sp.]
MALRQTCKYIILSTLSGAALAVSFPKMNLFFLAWIALIPLVSILMHSSVQNSLIFGFASGFVFNAVGLYWLIPMLKFNTDSYVQAFAASCALWVYLSLYWAVWSFFVNVSKRYFSCTWVISVFAACAWVLLEYARTYLLTGFPWMLIGYSQYEFTEIIQIAEFSAVYGISFLLVICNMFFYFWISSNKGNKYLLTAFLLIVLVSVFGVFRLDKFKYFGDETFTAVIVQPNVDQYKKWDQSYKDDILFDLEKYAFEASEVKPDLIAWPETALPDFLPWDKQTYKTVKRITQTAGGFSIIGAPYSDGSGRFFNAIFSFRPDVEGYTAIHKKSHLVPFGEYVPFQKFLSRFFGVLNELGNFVEGKDAKIFTDNKIYSGATLCSENFFPDISRRFCLNGAKVLTNHTNDAWFFDTAAPYQHFMMNIFRAVENRKAVIIAANSGVSGIIEASGRITNSTKVMKSALISGEFLQNDYLSFYTLHGDLFVKLCALVMVFLFIVILIIRSVQCLKHKRKESTD